MDNEQQLTEYIKTEKIDEMIEFLKSLHQQERQILSGLVIKLHEYYYDSTEVSKELLQEHIFKLMTSDKFVKMDFNIEENGTNRQRAMLSIALFVCANEQEYHQSTHLISSIVFEKDILSWYCPSWFSDYMIERTWMEFTYKHILRYTQQGCLKPTKRFIVDKITDEINENFDAILPLLLEEHIEYMFEESSDINAYHSWDDYPDWLEVFVQLIENNNISRKKVLSLSVGTVNKGFTTPLTSFFFNLLLHLKPENNEILHLQDSLLSVLETTFTKAINVSLKLLKSVCKDQNFNVELFIDKISILLAWDIKNIRNTTLMMIDNLIKLHPAKKDELALLSLSTLIHPDSPLQVKTIKLLAKHKLLDTQEITDEVALYYDGLFSDAKALLPQRVEESTMVEDDVCVVEPSLISDSNEIEKYESFDEILFFISQAFENSEAYHFDLYLALLPKLNSMLTEENVSKLQPIFHKASLIEIPASFERRSVGKVVYFIANSFVRYSLLIPKRFPSQREFMESFKSPKKVKIEKLDSNFKEIIVKKRFYSIYQRLIAYTDIQLASNSVIPLLSTPTHKPCWIDARVLIEQLAYYQDNNLEINQDDFQIALNRVVIDPQVTDLIENTLRDEVKDIMLYLFEVAIWDINKVSNPSLWIMALLRRDEEVALKSFVKKYEEVEQLYYPYVVPKWRYESKQYYYKEYNHRMQQHRNIKDTYRGIVMQKEVLGEVQKVENIYNIIDMVKEHQYFNMVDIDKFLLLSPFNLDAMLTVILKMNIRDSHYQSWKIDDNSMELEHINFLFPSLFNLWQKDCQNCYLYLALAICIKDTTIRNLASELWIKTVGEGTINHQLLGETLGKLQHAEYAPLKRFTDLIIANMLGISSLHNKSLAELLSAMISQMNDEPIKGTKKLLEIYLEVLSLTEQKPSSGVLEKLGVWGEVKSLSVIVKKIEKV